MTISTATTEPSPADTVALLLNIISSPGEWSQRAKCKGASQELFFPERYWGAAEQKAKRVCHECPVIDDCLSYALDLEVTPIVQGGLRTHGVFGGANPDERRWLLHASSEQKQQLRGLHRDLGNRDDAQTFAVSRRPRAVKRFTKRPWVDAAISVLADRQWHNRSEVTAAAKAAVPRTVAAEAADRKKCAPSTAPGILVNSCLWDMLKIGDLKQRIHGGSRQLRLTDRGFERRVQLAHAKS